MWSFWTPPTRSLLYGARSSDVVSMHMASSAAAAEGGGGGGAGSVMSRLERLDLMMQCLEEIRWGGRGASARWSSFASTSSSSAATGGGNSPPSPPPPERPLRSMEDVVVETLLKGSLIDRIVVLETRFLQMEEEMEKERKKEMEMEGISPKSREKRRYKLGLKSMVKSFVRGERRTKE